MFNVLTEPGIRFDWTGGTHAQASLPGVYAALMDKPESTEGRPWGQSLKKPSGAPLNLG